MADITCNVCGGTDFHKESGFYYCNECQTQSQDIQERVFAIDEEEDGQLAAKVKSSKKIRRVKKTDERLTSWECYNYILRGLVDELIELGADVKLKKTVQILWFLYLHKLEVTNSANELPKLSAVNSKIDAEIVYGRSTKRKKRSRSTPSPTSVSDAESSSSRRERSKRRRSLVLAEYDEFNATLQSDETSLLNQSLSSLQSADSSKEKDKYLQYNKYARKELLKHISKNHLKVHMRDVNSTHTCHKMSYRSVSTTHVDSPAVVSRAKIFALLYLGLLINKDNVQLGDLMRFIKEGRLSYHHINHFFPEEVQDQLSSIRTWNENRAFLIHYRMRWMTAQMAHFLDVTQDVPMQNLINLCRRYCNELNLPDDVWGYGVNLISKTCPKMKFTSKSIVIPNYEGRVLSIITFVLKLILGLDDETEFHFSNLAKQINLRPDIATDERMFEWNDWIYHIRYRKLLLTHLHFPTNNLFSDGKSESPDLAINFLQSDFMKMDNDVKLTRESEIIKNLLEKFRDKQRGTAQVFPTFPTSLTPFRTYTETLLKLNVVKEEQGYLTDVLQWNFSNSLFKFLITPFQYLNEMYKDCKISLKHRGANKKVKIVKYKNMKMENNLWRKHAKKETFVHVSSNNSSSKRILMERCTRFESTVSERNTKDIVRNFCEHNVPSFEKHKKKLIKNFKKDKNVLNTIVGDYNNSTFNQSDSQIQSDDNIIVHYIPHERYWLKNLNVNYISSPEFLKFFQTFPTSFQDVMTECARIAELEMKELYDEFTNVEVYLCYVAKFTITDKNRSKIANRDLSNLISKATKNW
ncbi:hypothetical protein FQR65_LT09189 [Abscondita terminalis]|nr:hypothetical protein FQR65_LT09189 [Abscondita terminalis]